MSMPPSAVRLRHRGRLLEVDGETVGDVLLRSSRDDDDDDDGDDDDEMDAVEGDDDIAGGGEDDDDDDDVERMVLAIDVVPPIDARFGIELRERTSKMSTREILDAYYLNVAGIACGMELHAREQQRRLPLSPPRGEGGEGEGGGGGDDRYHARDVRARALLARRQFEMSMSDETRRLVEEEHERVVAARGGRTGRNEIGGGGGGGGASIGGDDAASGEDDDGVVFGLVPRGGGSSSSSVARARAIRKKRGGATMNVRRMLQRNLNVVR
jgi:hypothetical protein